MSEYLGWQERKPAREFDATRLDRSAISGGPISDGYEAYIKSVFRPNDVPNESDEPLLNGVSTSGPDFQRYVSGCSRSGGSTSGYFPSCSSAPSMSYETVSEGIGTVGEGRPQKISATAMLRMENHMGKGALDDSYDNIVLKTPIESIYEELGIEGLMRGTQRKPGFSEFSVYQPKSTSEYLTTSRQPHSANPYDSAGSSYRGSYREESDAEWKKSNRQMLVDYKDFNSSPLSPYMYQNHPYVQRQDSRIIGSNFVQLTTRPRDRFLDKIDQTLAEVRAMPRY